MQETLDIGFAHDRTTGKWDWKKELAAQLNRLMTLANKLQQLGETEAMQDVDAAISRIAEFEGIQLARTNETANVQAEPPANKEKL